MFDPYLSFVFDPVESITLLSTLLKRRNVPHRITGLHLICGYFSVRIDFVPGLDRHFYVIKNTTKGDVAVYGLEWADLAAKFLDKYANTISESNWIQEGF